MKLAISGASGKTGFRIAEEAISRGHQVTLITRKSSSLPETLSNCKRRDVSLCNSKEIDEALSGNEGLIIATGARPSIDLTGPAKVDALGVKKQVKSAERVGIKRLVLVSSLCTGKLFHPLNLFGLILLWKRVGEDVIEKSSLEWTIVRPGGLNENEEDIENQQLVYTKENTQLEGYIPRRLVARCCVECLSTPVSINKIIEITSNSHQQKRSLKEAILDF